MWNPRNVNTLREGNIMASMMAAGATAITGHMTAAATIITDLNQFINHLVPDTAARAGWLFYFFISFSICTLPSITYF